MSDIPSKSGHEMIEVSIFHTNDMHARLDEMARLSTFTHQMEKEAQAEGKQTFLWDAGDAADRRMQFCSMTKGAAFPLILNAMGYTLQTMGNAISVTYGPQFMAAVAANANFPILAANCRDGDGPVIPGVKETVLIALNDHLKLGVIGLTAPAEKYYALFGYKIPHYCDVTGRLIAELKQQGATNIIVLSHLGIREDNDLAEKIPEIDVIIGGHSHTRLEQGELVNGVLIAQTGALAKAIGRVELKLDARSGRLISKSAAVIDVPEDIEKDTAVLAAIAAAEAMGKEKMSELVGELAGDFDQDYEHECGIGNLAADVLRERMHADAAIVTGGLFHGPLSKGKLTLGALDAACFTTANPAVSEVTGEQLLAALEQGLELDRMHFMHPSLRGAPVGLPQVSGIQIYYQAQALHAPRITQVMVQGHPLALTEMYRVAHTDAETMDEIGYLHIEPAQTITMEVPTILREAMADYIRDHSPVDLPEGKRWIQVSN